MWFIYAIITLLFWAFADLFYKKGAKENDEYSHLKTGIMVGLVMGIHATIYIITNNININFIDIIKYLPVSFFYIASMVIGYKGLRYLELSISSPIQNCSGVITAILLFIIFKETIGILDIVGIIMITFGMLLLSIIERQDKKVNIKKIIGITALIFPILYCILDGMGTFLDAIYLDKLTIVSEDIALVAYEYTFFIYGLILFIYLKFIKKEKFKLKEEKDKLGASIFETLGQFFYVFAISHNSTLSIPIISCYSMVSILLARIFLKEKLSKDEYIIVFIILYGILILGISEGVFI